MKNPSPNRKMHDERPELRPSGTAQNGVCLRKQGRDVCERSAAVSCAECVGDIANTIERMMQYYHDRAQSRPLVHCITNPISIHDCANVVLALGGKPIMAEHPREVADITSTAQSLAVNLGNITDARMESILCAGRTARDCHIPSIIDLVGVSCSELRYNLAVNYINNCHPTVIKGNLSELKTMMGYATKSNGVDVGDEDILTPQVMTALSQYSKRTGAVVLASGKTDVIVDGDSAFTLQNGVPMLAQITGTGCMLNVMVATFLAQGNGVLSALLGTAILGIAGEIAQTDKGTGSFQIALLDAISTMHSDIILQKIKLEECTL